MPRKYHDWQSWWDGLRAKALQAGAESLVTNLGTMLGSNGIASMIPSMSEYVLTWKTALITTTAQFLIRSLWAAAKYVAEKPEADIVTEDTTIITKP